MIHRLCASLVARLQGWFPPQADLDARGSGPALDRSIEDAIRRDERARHTTQADTAHGHMRRLSDHLYPDRGQR